MTQWIPIYESDFATVKSEIASFMAAFPYAEIFPNYVNGGGYDLTLIGHKEPLTVDIAGAEARLATPAYAQMRQSLSEAGFPTAASLWATYAVDKVGLADWLKDAKINHDSDMRLQYLAGASMDQDYRDEILQQILQYKRPPAGGLRFPTGFPAPPPTTVVAPQQN